jgi:hypothetical protein
MLGRVVNHRRVEQGKYIAIQALARFFQPFILLYPFPFDVQEAFQGDKQPLALFAALAPSPQSAFGASLRQLILEL